MWQLSKTHLERQCFLQWCVHYFHILLKITQVTFQCCTLPIVHCSGFVKIKTVKQTAIFAPSEMPVLSVYFITLIPTNILYTVKD